MKVNNSDLNQACILINQTAGYPTEQRINHDQIIGRLEYIESRYNPESDYNQNVPVSFGTIAMVQVVKELIKEIKYLRQEQDAIKELLYADQEKPGGPDQIAEAEALAAMQQAWQKAQAKTP